MPPADLRRALLTVLAAAALTFALFSIWPGLDLALSAPFHRPGAGFPLYGQWAVEALRNAIWNLSIAFVVLCTVAWVLALAGRPPLGLTARLWAFVPALYALATGLLVNVLLKDNWGRARPGQTAAFDGSAAFTPVWQVSDQCQSNCSFVSGEVSGATALAVGLWAILDALAPRLPRGLDRAGRAFALALPVVTAAQRLVTGRHFMSDVILSALFTLLVALALSPMLPQPRSGPRRPGAR